MTGVQSGKKLAGKHLVCVVVENNGDERDLPHVVRFVKPSLQDGSP